MPFFTDTLCLAISILFVLVLCGGALGICLARDPFRTLFLLFFVFYCLLIFFSVGNAKLRLPLMPFIMMYAGYFFSLLIGRAAAFTKCSAACAVLLCGLITLNSVYRYQDIAISPGEFNVRQVEVCADLGFPKTALFLIEKNKAFPHYSQQQRIRLKSVEHRLQERGSQ